ncbi:MAG: hypothetical protein ABIK28_08680 [Planctomycetota bacterium]
MAGARAPVCRSEFQFDAQSLSDLRDRRRGFTLSRDDLGLLNPNTRTCPLFTSSRDMERIKKIYKRLPILINESDAKKNKGNPWGIHFWSMFHMSGHSHLFRTREQLADNGAVLDPDRQFTLNGDRWLRLYESKLMHNLNHRYNTFEGTKLLQRRGIKPGTLPVDPAGRRDPGFTVEPRYWVSEEEVTKTVRRAGWDRRWFPALRSITNVSTNRRSVVASILPWCAVGNSATLVHTGPSAETAALLMACFSSFAFDYVTRTKLGGPNLNFFILKQLPAPPPAAFEQLFRGETVKRFIVPRVLELIFTARDLAPFARDLGFQGPPFAWDRERREQLRSELDALFFLMYGMRRSELESIFSTFPILKRQEEASGNEFRTQRLTLKAYDLMVDDWPHT